MERASTASTKLAFALGIAVMGWCIFRAATAPVTAAEATLYGRVARLPLLEAMLQPDAWNGIVYTSLSRRAVGLFRLSEFTFRLPALLAAGAFLVIAFRMTARWRIGFVLLSAWAATTPIFTLAGGAALASAFLAAAAWILMKELQLHEHNASRNLNLCGMLLGLAVAASWRFAVPAVILAAFSLAILRRWQPWVERLIATACVTAFIILFLPAVHASPPQPLPDVDPVAVREAIAALRTVSGSHPARILSDPSLQSYLIFYKGRYRIRTWEVVGDTTRPNYIVTTRTGLPMPAVHQGPVSVYRFNPAIDGGFQPPSTSPPSH